MKKHVFLICLIIALSLPLVWPFFQAGYFPTHDGEWAVVRLGAMHRAFIDHHFPARWAGNLNFGYGYPLFNFTYPLPYYIGELFNIIGFGLVGSIKLLFVLSVFLSGGGMFLLGKELYGKTGGFFAALFYLYIPYRMVNLYVRGSIGESLSLALFPFLFLSVYKIVKGGSWRWSALLGVLYGSLLLMHNVSALLFSPFLFAFALFLLWREKNILIIGKRLLIGFVLGIMQACFFLIPAILEKQQIVLSQTKLTNISEYFVTLPQLIMPSWGYESYGQENGMSVQLGWSHLLAILLVAWLLARKKNRDDKLIVGWLSIMSLLLLVALILPVSLPFWQNAPLFSDVDFPWRVLGPAIFFVSLPLGMLTMKKLTTLLGAILLLVAIFATLPYAKAQNVSDFPDGYYFTNEATTTSTDELMPIWVKEKPKERAPEKVEIANGEGRINELVSRSIKTSFQLDVVEESRIRINTIYFPGWEVNVDGKPAHVGYDNPSGVIEFAIDRGKHFVTATFIETPLRVVSNIISIIALLFIATLFSFPKLWQKRLGF